MYQELGGMILLMLQIPLKNLFGNFSQPLFKAKYSLDTHVILLCLNLTHEIYFPLNSTTMLPSSVLPLAPIGIISISLQSTKT
jgi:hypothetical protein